MPTPIADKLREELQQKYFYDLLQAYRHAPVMPQHVVAERFRAIQSFLVGFVADAEKNP